LWIESSQKVTHTVVYTPEHAVCVEPQTCATDAFNLPVAAGVQIVEPGRPLVATTRWRWATAEPQWQQIHPRSADDERDS
jgi:galactose mutarotase-like enzyme